MGNYTQETEAKTRGIATPQNGAEIPEEEAVTLVEQQAPLFEDGRKCKEI